ncbi:hypothetical protein NQ315_011583 [Exocentrus adspersus]|uniref:Peptidase S1 domain-containing protein n=1 Tax=Exocentrus adspersus TaxID=1586481 RepID=A0AAV8VW61_9CUCU|nr:hypothetical protein NQ315_011583 [Exocentrus adspersus]
MKVAVYLFAVLSVSVALPGRVYNSSWSEIKGVNLIIKPVSDDYTADEVNNGRIIGGDEASPHSKPYQVGLLINGESFCSGSMISPSYVLTAAHCTATASYVELIFGAHNVNIQESTQVRVTSSNIITYPEYKIPFEHSNDVALINTPNPIVTNNYITTVRLAPIGAGPFEGYTPVLSGWGSTSGSSTSISATLREVYLVVMANYLCASHFGSTYSESSNLCTYGGDNLFLQNTSWSEIKGVNLIIKPVSDDYTADEVNNGRIIGGDEASPHSKPYQVGLLINGESFCSGSMISPSYVLTAAHCTATASYVELIFGAHNVNIQESTQVRVTSSNIITHPEYKIPFEHSNDIALINTPNPIVTNNYITTVRLAPIGAGPYKVYASILSGWGSTSGSNTGPVGGCNGDSGAPLVVGNHQIGILSFIASEGCEKEEPTGYNSSWSKIKGVNLIIKPVSDDYTADEVNNGRIIGGDEASPHSKPYQVGLLINGESFCSGSMISPSYVLTAAHCTATASYVELIFGAHNVNIQESTQVRVTSSNIITHPEYKNPYEHSNDIALINTPNPIVTNNYITTVRLAPIGAGPYKLYVSILSGWGSTSDSNTGISATLQEVYVVVMTNYICAFLFGSTYSESSNLCTYGGGPVGGCNGDSGAPLVVGNHQIGILSFIASEGCEKEEPTGYNTSWSEIKGVNLIIKPVSDDYTADEVNNGRIIGGDEASPHSKPYQVGLLINGESFCSGSMISPSYVLTAAHCTATASYVELIFGAHNVNIQESTQVRVTSSNIITHPEYKNPYEHSNDIALINTPNPIVTNNYITTVRLAPIGAGPYKLYVSILSGWGSTSDSNTGISATLQEVYVVVMTNYICAFLFGSTYSESSNLCTYGGGPVGGCNGDSGAPLVVGNHQIGILSFIASEGCEKEEPTGYVRVSNYREWINQHAGL